MKKYLTYYPSGKNSFQMLDITGGVNINVVVKPANLTVGFTTNGGGVSCTSEWPEEVKETVGRIITMKYSQEFEKILVKYFANQIMDVLLSREKHQYHLDSESINWDSMIVEILSAPHEEENE